MRITAVLAAISLLLSSCATQPASVESGAAGSPPAEARYPVARVENIVDTYHGTAVTDPYRWMEAGGDEMNRWLEAQRAHARASLDALPERKALLESINVADRGVTRVTVVAVTGDAPRVFLMKRQPDADVAQL